MKKKEKKILAKLTNATNQSNHRINFTIFLCDNHVEGAKTMENNNESAIEMDAESSMGHFGWKELNDGLVIPYIIREKQKKYCSLHIFKERLAQFYHIEPLGNDLNESIQTYPQTKIESYLLNEINHAHCDSSSEHCFVAGDPLIRLADGVELAQFFYDCHQKFKHGVASELKQCGILSLKLTQSAEHEYLVPYVRVNGTIRLAVEACKFVQMASVHCRKLTGLHLYYMKFVVHKVLQINLNNMDECATLEEIRKAHGPKRILALEYWPINARWQPSGSTKLETIPTIDIISDTSSNVSRSSSHDELRSLEMIGRAAEQCQLSASQSMKNARVCIEQCPLLLAKIERIEQKRELDADVKVKRRTGRKNGIAKFDRTSPADSAVDINANETSSQSQTKKRKRTTRKAGISEKIKSEKPKGNAKQKAPTPEFYPVERVMDRKVDAAGKVWCLIRWQNFDSSHDSWEPIENCTLDVQAEANILYNDYD